MMLILNILDRLLKTMKLKITKILEKLKIMIINTHLIVVGLELEFLEINYIKVLYLFQSHLLMKQ
nr:MAG TPA: hypothetical protein [Crassvirales sp.]